MPIANARMYSVNAAVKAQWHRLLTAALQRAELDWPVIDYDAPASLKALWSRDDLGLVMMCGLPFTQRVPRAVLVATPVPKPAEFGGLPVYWTDIVVRSGDSAHTLADTFGGVVGYTLADSFSGSVAWAAHLCAAVPDCGGRPSMYCAAVGGLIHARGVIDALISGRIDVGPLDSYYHALLRRHEPALAAQVRVVDRTVKQPIPPLIATAPVDDASLARLRKALQHTARDDSMRACMDDLLLDSFAVPGNGIRAADYEPMAEWGRRLQTEFRWEPR